MNFPRTELWSLLTLFSLTSKQKPFFKEIFRIIWSRKVIGIEQKLDNIVFYDALSNNLDYSNITWSKDLFK